MKSRKKSPPRKKAASLRRRRTVSTAAKSRTVAVKSKAKPAAGQSRAPRPLANRARVTRKTPQRIPPVLLEDDRPSGPQASGPGQKYVAGTSSLAQLTDAVVELPEAYGTQKLFLTARDPHWLYAHWDLTREQQLRFNSLSADRHLVLRVREDAPEAPPANDTHVHPESRHWFVHVTRPATKYVAELGFYAKDGTWSMITASSPTVTPPERASEDVSAQFVSIPSELPLSHLVSLAKEAAGGNLPLAAALDELRAQGHPELPASATVPPPAHWTPGQERALAEVLSMDATRRVWIGSLEITELIRQQLAQELASQAAAALAGAPTSPAEAPGAISSPAGGQPPAHGFWFDVNAELIVYGATEPGASVTIGGRPIRLRPDGSFSYRFALPDGRYELPITALSADQMDARGVELKFSRDTQHMGEVRAHPQDPSLKPPMPENL